MEKFDIYMCGVGGQGIGLLSEVLLRAADNAGYAVKGVDTHGLAQRGGLVISHLRLGAGVFSPLVAAGAADLAVAMERHEAVGALNRALKDNGTLVYYDAVWQPLEVRLNQADQITSEAIAEECRIRGIREYRVLKSDLQDARMQNVVLLAALCRNGLIPGLTRNNFVRALDDLLAGPILESNLALFEEECQQAGH